MMGKHKTEEQKEKRLFILCIAAGGSLLTILLLTIGYYWFRFGRSMAAPAEEARSYAYHCAFISNNFDDPLSAAVFEGARVAGEEQNVYLENYGEQLSLHYEMEDLLQMAIASGVDAVILNGADTPDMTGLIDQAVESGIAVVTVLEDNLSSKRCSFVGVNNFRMGYEMCRQALNHMGSYNKRTERGEILVLFDQAQDNSEQVLVTSGMQRYLEENSGSYTLRSQLIDSRGMYNAEEQIRMLLRDISTRPAVVICTSLVQTQCMEQILVDLNCVGDVKVIGYYYTQAILEAIREGIIQASYAINTKELGTQAVNSIREYKQYGFVSDYVTINADVIDETHMIDETSRNDTGT
jgi:ribose transport system substrate-binding protein